MATFFSGLVIGFINCWQIALITLATGPFIVAAGGISNIFLHRLAESIQDAYAEAASIAEQVILVLWCGNKYSFCHCMVLNCFNAICILFCFVSSKHDLFFLMV